MAHELAKTLLLEEAVDPAALADALFVSLQAKKPLVKELVDSGAVSHEVLTRYLARTNAPFLRQVLPARDLVARLPPGLCERLLAVPVRLDAVTGTVDIAVADPNDAHPAREIAFHLDAPIRIIRSPVGAIVEALRTLATREPLPAERAPAISIRPPAPGAEAPAIAAPPMRGRMQTPPWGTPIHSAPVPPSDPPRSGLGSEIPIPLTRKSFSRVAGGTQRPPPMMLNPGHAGLGEGIPVDAGSLRAIVEVQPDLEPEPPPPFTGDPSEASDPPYAIGVLDPRPLPSFIPGPPPVLSVTPMPELPFADASAILAALKIAGTRDEVLDLVMTGSHLVAGRVAIFVTKRDGYQGWACTPEFADRAALQMVLVPLDARSVFAHAVSEGMYLGPIRPSPTHATLLQAMGSSSADVAIVPIRVGGKTAAIIVADDLADTMIATRRFDSLARAAGDAFARIVRMRK